MKYSGFLRLTWLQIWNILRKLFCGKHFGKLWVLLIKNSFWVNSSIVEIEIADSQLSPEEFTFSNFYRTCFMTRKALVKGIWHFMRLTFLREDLFLWVSHFVIICVESIYDKSFQPFFIKALKLAGPTLVQD